MKTEHLTSEQIDIYVRGKADRRLFDYVEDHRRKCGLCDNLLDEDLAVVGPLRDALHQLEPVQPSKPQQH